MSVSHPVPFLAAPKPTEEQKADGNAEAERRKRILCSFCAGDEIEIGFRLDSARNYISTHTHAPQNWTRPSGLAGTFQLLEGITRGERPSSSILIFCSQPPPYTHTHTHTNTYKPVANTKLASPPYPSLFLLSLCSPWR